VTIDGACLQAQVGTWYDIGPGGRRFSLILVRLPGIPHRHMHLITTEIRIAGSGQRDH
jgi:hypothetical protein